MMRILEDLVKSDRILHMSPRAYLLAVNVLSLYATLLFAHGMPALLMLAQTTMQFKHALLNYLDMVMIRNFGM